MSTDLQYHLVERIVALGWPRERVHIIDEDLGKSGASADQRLGFQRLLADIGLARVGLVTSFDASRLARNNSDWYHLLELCALFGTLIADSEQLYDPRLYHALRRLGWHCYRFRRGPERLLPRSGWVGSRGRVEQRPGDAGCRTSPCLKQRAESGYREVSLWTHTRARVRRPQ